MTTPRSLAQFIDAIGEAPRPIGVQLGGMIRLLASTSHEGVILLGGNSALWVLPWVLDALQPGTRVVTLVDPAHASRITKLGRLVDSDLRLAIRVQDLPSFLADMGDQKFDLIVDLDAEATAEAEQAQLLPFGSLIRADVQDLDNKDCVDLILHGAEGEVLGQVVKPRPVTLRRKGGRKARLSRQDDMAPGSSTFAEKGGFASAMSDAVLEAIDHLDGAQPK